MSRTNKTNDKLALLVNYFSDAKSDQDKLWTIALFTHRRPKRPVTTKLLKLWCRELCDIPEWLFDECYQNVGDLAETISLLLEKKQQSHDQPLHWWIDQLIQLRTKSEEDKKSFITWAWTSLSDSERFAFTKLMTGGMRIGVSQNMVLRALSAVLDLDKSVLAHRIMGDWDPATTTYSHLLTSESKEDFLSRPYPFYLAYPLEKELSELENPEHWQAEWKWDGIRAQIVCRQGEFYVWSRGEELVTDKFPELDSLRQIGGDWVMDGEILPFKEGQVLSFQDLQTRIGRKTISKKLLEQSPVVFRAFDLLEWQGEDLRSQALRSRRSLLEKCWHENAAVPPFQFSSAVSFSSWDELTQLRTQAREKDAEGFMLKHKDSPYLSGRKRGDWWKWKVEPLTIDGVLIYAQKGSGRRAGLFSDYTFGVWDGDQLVSFAKAYSGLSDVEMRAVDSFVKKNTKEKFGPVRTVKAELVFEIGFEGIAQSNRHKSGVALRFPRMLRWRKDKPKEEANTLSDLHEILERYGRSS